MNIWLVVITCAKAALWIIIAFISLVCLASNLTETINTLREKKRAQENVVFNALLWTVLEVISLVFLLKMWI